MLGKLRLKPSLLLEVAFILAVWLVAWKVLDASLIVTVTAIFGAYVLVFVYENWLAGLARRERSEQRRTRREEATWYEKADSSPLSKSPSTSSVSKVEKDESRISTRQIREQLVTDLHESEESLPPEVIAAETLRVREDAAAAAERERVERGQTQREQAEAETPPEPEPESEAQPEPESEPERRSLLAEFAASPGETRHTHTIGGWNVWQLERMLSVNIRPDAERDYERSLLLVYLREFADSDGQLPPEFDELANESFGDLVRGPAGP